MNKIELVGNLTKDCEMNYFKDGASMATLNLAVSHSYDDKADFFYIKKFNVSENLAKYLTKGSKIAVVGHLKNNNFTDDDGYTEFRNDIVGDEIELLNSTFNNEENNKVEETQENKRPRRRIRK